MADALDKILGSPYRVKIMKLFLMNPGEVFTPEYISKSSKLLSRNTRKEINFLKNLGFIKSGIREIDILISKTKKIKKKREPGFQLNPLFTYNRGLRSLLIESAPVSRELLMKRFRELGRGLRFVALSGIFVGQEIVGDSRGLDIMFVGDNIGRLKLEKVVGKIESELGKELKYVLFDTNEFKYRHSMYDRFVLDVLDNEHDVLFDSLQAGV